MKTQLKMTLIASAVAAVVASPAMAVEPNGDVDHRYRLIVEVDVDKNIDVEKNVDVNKDIDIEKNVEKNYAVNKSRTTFVDNFLRDIAINAQAGASAVDRQLILENQVNNKKLINNASLGDDVGSGASGNIGMNVSAGDTNVQDNAAALAAVDAGFVFGESAAAVGVHQANMANTTFNSGVANNASIGQNAFSGASGNIGVNVAAGTGNAQKNTMAASVSTARVANATLDSYQESIGNNIRNEGRTEEYTELTRVTLTGGSSGGYVGAGAGSYSGDTSSTITGSLDQIGDVYPDIWTDAPHPGGSADGHFDLDTATQGGSDLNQDGGALAFGTNDMTSEGSESGTLGFRERGTIGLSTVLSGQVATTRYVVVNAKNDASLLGSAFSGAAGNIGVNVASGTGNLQSNSLSMAVSCVTCAGGSDGGSE